MEYSDWTAIDGKIFIRATNIVMKQIRGVKKLQSKDLDNRMREAIMEESKVNESELIELDPDIEEMNIWTYEKIRLQEKRNANKKDFSMDELIGRVEQTHTSESLADLF